MKRLFSRSHRNIKKRTPVTRQINDDLQTVDENNGKFPAPSFIRLFVINRIMCNMSNNDNIGKDNSAKKKSNNW